MNLTKSIQDFFNKIWTPIEHVIEKLPYGRRLLDDYRFRTLIFQVPGAASNLIFAIFNGIMAIHVKSAWIGSLAAYYILLVFMRAGALHSERKIKAEENLEEKHHLEVSIYRRNSLLFICLGIILSGMTAFLGSTTVEKSYPWFLIYGVAFYAFYRFIVSLVNAIKARKMVSPLVKIVRRLNYLDACVAILSLQTALFTEFSRGNEAGLVRFTNITVSTAIVCLTFYFGISGIVRNLEIS